MLSYPHDDHKLVSLFSLNLHKATFLKSDQACYDQTNRYTAKVDTVSNTSRKKSFRQVKHRSHLSHAAEFLLLVLATLSCSLSLVSKDGQSFL